MIVVDVEIDAGLQQYQAIIDRLDNPRPVLLLMGEMLEEYERDVFATRGFGTWAGIDEATAQAKDSGRVLVDTGDLLKHLTTSKIEADSAVVNQGDSYYGRFLRDGDRGMPKRDPAPVPDESRVAGWAQQVLGFLVEGTR